MSELTKQQKFGCFMAIVRVLLATPLYYALLYLILKHIEATDTIWLLFWIYAPVSIGLLFFAETVGALLKDEKDEK